MSSENKTDLAISIYLYHIDMWQEIYSLLRNISIPYKLYIGLCVETASPSLELKIKEDLINLNINYIITYHENYGADIAPFLRHLSIMDEPYFIKLHSKKSKLGINKQTNWSAVLFNDLIGYNSVLANNLYRLRSTKNLGLLGNKENINTNLEHTNSQHIKDILSLLGIDYELVKNGKFIGGTMFMAKTALYKNIFTTKNISHIDKLLYSHKGRLSDNIVGTYAHAMERIFGYIITYQNMLIKHINNKSIPIDDHKKNIHHDLVIMYNNDCYIKNFVGTYGHIVNSEITNDSKKYTVLWADDKETVRTYNIKNSCKKNKFDAIAYGIRNPDLNKMNYKQLYEHFYYYGIKENRNTELDHLPSKTSIKQLKHQFINNFNSKNIINNKQPLILINHDVSLTGAPIYLYNLYDYLVQNTIYDPNQIYLLDAYPNTLFKSSVDTNFLYHFNDINLIKLIFQKLNPGCIYSNSLNFYAANLYYFPQYIKQTFLHFHEDSEYINTWMTAPHAQPFPDYNLYTTGVVSKFIKDSVTAKYSQFSPKYVCPPFLSKNKIDTIISKSKLKNNEDPVLNLDYTKPIICMCGSLCLRKNPKLFLDISKVYNQYEFIWIGGDKSQDLITQLKNLYNLTDITIPNNFHWIPYTSNPYYYINISDYLFVTSNIDPCPTIILEALALNKQIITIYDNVLTKYDSELISYLHKKTQSDLIQEFQKLKIIKTNYFHNANMGYDYILKNYSKPNLSPIVKILHDIDL